MTDDQFTLGNFDGLEELDGNTSDTSEVLAQHSPLPNPPPQGEGIIKHPTVKADPQAKFRSPRPELRFIELDLDKIVPNEFQPRRVFDEQKLQELAQSIRENGIIQPLVVLERADGLYEIVVGERRARASRLAGLSRVPAFVSQPLGAQVKLELAIIENVQRADLNPIEEAKAYQQLHDEFGLTIDRIAERVGRKRSSVANLMRLLNLPIEVQRALMEEVISEGQARPLLTLRDREEILAMYRIVKERQMKVRDVENKVREISQRKIKVSEMFAPDPFLDSLESMLRSRLGTRVELSRGAKGGKITIEFYSDEELSEIVRKMADQGGVDN